MESFESKTGTLARVRHVDNAGAVVYFETRSGHDGYVRADRDLGVDVGDVILVTDQDLTLAPADAWAEPTWIGVVRLIDGDDAIIDVNGTFKRVPNRSVSAKVNNTVEGKGTDGVLRVLSEMPIRHLDLGSSEALSIERFKIEPQALVETYADFGGRDELLRRAKELIELPLERRQALNTIRAKSIKGVLFTGDPGTGKTMLARIIAKESNAAFYEISGPQVFSKWFGESEEIIRRIFEDAAQEPRSIIFFDEIDSVAVEREGAHEASRRVVAQLLAVMDGFDRDDNVIVIAATNRPQDIDIALRRPGRFDWEIYFPLPDQAARAAILRTSARRVETRGVLPHDVVADRTAGWSAADLTAIWSEAALLAVADSREAIGAEDYMGAYGRVEARRRERSVGPCQTKTKETA